MGKNTSDRTGESTGIRLDKWLWCSRFYKTRASAANAIKTGKVEVNGERVKSAHTIVPGARIRIRRGPYAHEVSVVAVSTMRRSAAEARTLYVESAENVAARELIAAQIEADRMRYPRTRGRPGKRNRRLLMDFKQRGGEPV